MVNFPFQESVVDLSKNKVVVLRTFSEKVHSEDLLWHWDEEDRIISTNQETDWLFQFDNKLPQRIQGRIEIPKGMWHRLIKGTGDLSLTVEKIGYINLETS